MTYLLIDNLSFAFLFYRKEIIRSSYLKKFIYHQIYSRKGGDSLLLKGNVFESGSKKKAICYRIHCHQGRGVFILNENLF